MIGINSLLDMICTEAIEGGDIMTNHPAPESHHPSPALPPINYALELIEGPDGTYVWME